MKKLLSLFAGVAMAFSMLTSCTSSDSNDLVVEQSISNFFAYVTDLTTGTDAYYPQISYTLRLNYTKLTADVMIFNLRTPDGTSYPTLSLTGIPWRMTEKQIIVQGTNLTPSGASIPATFSTFNLTYSPRTIENNVMAPGVGITFTINNRFSVTSANPAQIAFGTTTTTDAEGQSFESTKTYYSFTFNSETRRVNITMYNSSFIPQMPAMNIELVNVPYVIDGAMAKWDVEAITPQIGGVPYGAFPITNLKGTFNFNTGLNMSFDCTPSNMGLYHVDADCAITNSQQE